MEDDLIARAQAGDEHAFGQLVTRYADAAWRLARVLLPDRALAEDTVQEAWVDVWQHLPSFDLHRPLRPWLLVIVTNRCRKLVRKHAPLVVSLDDDAANLAEQIPGGTDAAQLALRAEADATLAAAVATLPADQQRVLELRFFADLDLAEIALVLDAPVGTVKSRLHRALRTLRDRLHGDATRLTFEVFGHE